jgi:hypothetical protein
LWSERVRIPFSPFQKPLQYPRARRIRKEFRRPLNLIGPERAEQVSIEQAVFER